MRVVEILAITRQKLGNGVYLLEHELGFSIFPAMGPKAFAYGYGCLSALFKAFKGRLVNFVHGVITANKALFSAKKSTVMIY